MNYSEPMLLYFLSFGQICDFINRKVMNKNELSILEVENVKAWTVRETTNEQHSCYIVYVESRVTILTPGCSFRFELIGI